MTTDSAAPGLATFSPRGDALLYYLDHHSGADISLLSLTNGRSQRVTKSGGGHYYASWSPDGNFLLTTSAQDADGMRYDIRCISFDGVIDVSVIDDINDARSAALRPMLFNQAE